MPAGPGFGRKKRPVFSLASRSFFFSSPVRAILLKCDLVNLDALNPARFSAGRAAVCAVAMNEDGTLFYTVIRRVAIRINDAVVTNDVFVIFQPCLFPPLLFRPASLPPLSSFFPSVSSCAPFFSRHFRGQDSRDEGARPETGRREEKSDKRREEQRSRTRGRKR